MSKSILVIARQEHNNISKKSGKVQYEFSKTRN